MKYPNIELERKQHNVTQNQLAELIDVSVKTLHNWQRGTHPMPVDKLVAMSQLFNCSLDYLASTN